MTCAIQSITIKDFKSIAELTLDLGKVNVLIGENGAGKSNILEAIGVLSAAAGGNTSYARLKDRGIRLSAPEIFKIALKNKKRKNRFVLDAHFSSGIFYHLSLSPRRDDVEDSLRFWTESLSINKKNIISRNAIGMKVFTRSYEKIKSDTGIFALVFPTKKITNTLNEITPHIKILEKYAIFTPSIQALRNTMTDESSKAPLGLNGGGLASAVATLLRAEQKNLKKNLFAAMNRIFPWIQTYGRAEPPQNLVSYHVHLERMVVAFRDKRMSDSFNRLLAYDVSEGALYALFLLVLILHEGTPPFFAVDNMDSALNPRLADALLSEAITLIKEQPKRQMILTTHNPSMLNALDLFDDDVRLFVVERSEQDGSTIVRRIKPLDDMTREQWRELMQGHTLSSLWTSGALGGLPKISF